MRKVCKGEASVRRSRLVDLVLEMPLEVNLIFLHFSPEGVAGNAELGGFFHCSLLRRGRFIFAPDAGKGGLDLFLEAGDQFAVSGDEGLLSFDLGDDGLLRC